MSAKSYWLRYWHNLQVRQRATLYQLFNSLSRSDAYAAAARDIADQQRAERQDRHRLKTEKGNTLLTSIYGMLERMHPDEAGHGSGSISGPEHPTMPRSAVPPAAIRKRVSEPELAEGYPDGVFMGNVTGAQRIPDKEYHSSIHALDRSTHNWRLSLQRNAEIEAERRALWAERLAELKAEGKLQ
jgi:hypothetical protein